MSSKKRTAKPASAPEPVAEAPLEPSKEIITIQADPIETTTAEETPPMTTPITTPPPVEIAPAPPAGEPLKTPPTGFSEKALLDMLLGPTDSMLSQTAAPVSPPEAASETRPNLPQGIPEAALLDLLVNPTQAPPPQPSNTSEAQALLERQLLTVADALLEHHADLKPYEYLVFSAAEQAYLLSARTDKPLTPGEAVGQGIQCIRKMIREQAKILQQQAQARQVQRNMMHLDIQSTPPEAPREITPKEIWNMNNEQWVKYRDAQMRRLYGLD